MNDILKNFVGKLNDDNLKFLHERLTNRLQGDLPEVLLFIESNYREVDRWLNMADNAESLYDMVDQIKDAVTIECNKRNAYNKVK